MDSRELAQRFDNLQKGIDVIVDALTKLLDVQDKDIEVEEPEEEDDEVPQPPKELKVRLKKKDVNLE